MEPKISLEEEFKDAYNAAFASLESMPQDNVDALIENCRREIIRNQAYIAALKQWLRKEKQ